jgi:hypothetical protein
VFTLAPILAGRVALVSYFLKTQQHKSKIEEGFFFLQVFWVVSYGYWTLYNFFTLSRGALTCLSKGQFSLVKVAYQVALVCGGFSAILCVAGAMFFFVVLPFLVFDWLKREYVKRRDT